jgi:imidazolonepropionase-like amidohydrolase
VVSLGMEGQMERMNTRNLPFYAGTLAAHGLDKEVALKLLTSNTAKILGIDDFVGTLEVGKDATLFISDGDALDMRTNILSDAFIQGRKISLETHQTKLWKRYSKKYKTK